MARLLIFALMIFLVIYLFKRKILTRNRQNSSKTIENPPAEAMVKCKFCGVHLPISEALKKQNDYYCSNVHLPVE